MAMYLIGYDLNQPGKNYDALHDAIKRLGTTWCRPLDSTWIVSHPGPATAIRDELMRHIDRNDALLVTGLTGERAWVSLHPKVSDWLKAA
ncbi:MAG: hypothetical protein K0Q68_2349 [Moraxellaceae bacterium]|jgi:hypothetical protein|nr:hypothetical protein [Moraxellaceae bacterium]